MKTIKLYRIMSYDEEKKFKQGILTFEIDDPTYRDFKVNTFDYGDGKESELAYRKHFFLTIEDAYKYKRSCGIKREVVKVFNFPEELVVRNIGIGKYAYGKYCFEVAIPFNEMINYLNAQSISELKQYEKILFDINNIQLEEEYIYEYESLEYKKFYESMQDILLELEEDGKLNLNLAQKYFDSEENRKIILEKIKVSLK